MRGLRLIPGSLLSMAASTLPPSSVTILTVLDSGAGMSHKDLVKMTRLSPFTVRYGLKKLKEQRLVIEKMNMRDMREIIYLNRVLPGSCAGKNHYSGCGDPEEFAPVTGPDKNSQREME